MKKICILIIGTICIAGMNGAWADDGETIFKANGCLSCHKAESNSKVNPSLLEISHAYQGKEEQLSKYLRGESVSIIKPEKSMSMKRQIEKTKKLSDAELKGLVDYLLHGH